MACSNGCPQSSTLNCGWQDGIFMLDFQEIPCLDGYFFKEEFITYSEIKEILDLD